MDDPLVSKMKWVRRLEWTSHFAGMNSGRNRTTGRSNHLQNLSMYLLNMSQYIQGQLTDNLPIHS